MDGISVRTESSVRHLGVTFTSTLKWSAHLSLVSKSVSWKVSLLKRLAFQSKLQPSVYSLLYKSLLRPCLEYAGCVWDGCSSSDSALLEGIQLSLARSLLAAHHGSSFLIGMSKPDILAEVSLPTLAWRRRRQKLRHFWLLRNGLGPPSLSAKLPATVSERCTYSLRSPHSSQIPLCVSSAHMSSFLPSTCSLWNTLPSHVAQSKSLSSFINLLDKFYAHDIHKFGLPS